MSTPNMALLSTRELSIFFILNIFAAIAAASNFANVNGAQIAAYFEQVLSPGSEVYLPTDSNFTDETAITQRWNSFSEPTYAVAVKPATEGDVQKVVSLRTIQNSALNPFF